MMFTCSAHAPSSAAATKAASRKIIKKSGKKSFAVDLHCHVHVPEADAGDVALLEVVEPGIHEPCELR